MHEQRLGRRAAAAVLCNVYDLINAQRVRVQTAVVQDDGDNRAFAGVERLGGGHYIGRAQKHIVRIRSGNADDGRQGVTHFHGHRGRGRVARAVFRRERDHIVAHCRHINIQSVIVGKRHRYGAAIVACCGRWKHNGVAAFHFKD